MDRIAATDQAIERLRLALAEAGIQLPSLGVDVPSMDDDLPPLVSLGRCSAGTADALAAALRRSER